MAAIEILAQNFRNLEGITLNERKRNFCFYLNDIKKSVTSAEDRKSFTSLLKPRNILEEVLYTHILLTLQESRGLLNILTGNHVRLQRMVLRSTLFLDVLKKNFDEITSDQFSTDICFLVRLRILIRLGLIFQDDDRLDHYYHAIRKKYGLHLAKHLLPACKLATITEEMKKNRVIFNNKQLTKMHKRFPDLLESYFNHLKDNNIKNFNIYDKLVRQIAANDLELFFKLLTKHELKTKLSRNCTIKFVAKYKEEVLKNGEKYLDILHKYTAFKQLNLEEFPLLYAKLFPKSFNDFKIDLVISGNDDIINVLVKRVPKSYQFTIVNDVFKKRYNSNLLDYDELFTEALLEIVPANLREGIIAKKMTKDNKDDWLIFYEMNKAEKMIKEKISKTADPNKRRNLVNLLVKSCLVNKDIPRLAEIFEYIAIRHRNEDSSLFSNIFNELYEVNMEKFNGKHWDWLNKLLKIYNHNKQDAFHYSSYIMSKCIEAYWAYKIRENLPITEDLINYKKQCNNDYSLNIFQEKKYRKERKVLFDILAEILPDLIKDLPKNSISWCTAPFFLQSIVDYNYSLKKDKINLSTFPFLIKYISDLMETTSDEDNEKSYIFGILATVRHIKETDVYKKVCDEIWKNKPEYHDHKWAFFLKYQPQYIVQNYEEFFSRTHLHNDVNKFIEDVQYYSHLGIPQLYSKKSKEILMDPELKGHNIKLIIAVRFLVNSEEFLPAADRFLPKKAYDHKSVDEETNFVQVKKTISEVLGSYKNLEDTLKPVLALAKSDYLKYCLQSIYKIAYNLPESKLTNFMEAITSGKNSLSKHVMFITTRISDQEHVYKILKNVGLNEKDASIQKYLIKSTFSYFNQNPSDEFFELLKDHCKLLNEYESEGFDLLLKFSKIPIQYLSKYVEFLWEFTQNSNIDEVRDVKYKILENLDEDLMKIFKEEFLDTLVIKCLKFEKSDADKMYDFIYRYIITGDLVNASKRVNFVISQFPKSITAKDMLLSQNVIKFTIGLCDKLIEEHKKKNCNAKTILVKYREAWNKVYSVENNFDQATALELTEHFLESETYNQTLLVQKSALFLNDLLQKYNNYIIPNLAVTFRKMFFTLMKIQELQDDEELFKFLLIFLQTECTFAQVDKEYFVLCSLLKTFPKATNAKEKHFKILEMLEKSASTSIRMNLTCYINSFEEKKDEADDKCVPICNMRC